MNFLLMAASIQYYITHLLTELNLDRVNSLNPSQQCGNYTFPSNPEVVMWFSC